MGKKSRRNRTHRTERKKNIVTYKTTAAGTPGAFSAFVERSNELAILARLFEDVQVNQDGSIDHEEIVELARRRRRLEEIVRDLE